VSGRVIRTRPPFGEAYPLDAGTPSAPIHFTTGVTPLFAGTLPTLTNTGTLAPHNVAGNLRIQLKGKPRTHHYSCMGVSTILRRLMGGSASNVRNSEQSHYHVSHPRTKQPYRVLPKAGCQGGRRSLPWSHAKRARSHRGKERRGREDIAPRWR